MPHTDARKTPWYLDLTPAEMEEVIAAVPALLEVAKAAADTQEAYDHFRGVIGRRSAEHGDRFDTGFMTGIGHMRIGSLAHLIEELEVAHPAWRTWLTVEQAGHQ